MLDKGSVLLEVLPTVRAVKGPLLCVNPIVLEESGAGVKPLPAFFTLTGPLPRVALVYNQFGVPPEALPTLPTLIGPFLSVDYSVVNQGGSPPEALPTFQTLVWLLPIVKLLMDHWVRALAASLAQAGSFLLRSP